jgi:hypothetical protein
LHGNLLAKGEVLEHEVGATPNQRSHRNQQQPNEMGRGFARLAVAASKRKRSVVSGG